MVKTVLAVEGQGTDVESVRNQFAHSRLQSNDPPHRSINSPSFFTLPFLFPAALPYDIFRCLIWCSPCFQCARCSTPDPLHLSPPYPLICLLTWELLTYLFSILWSPRFPRRGPIVVADQAAVGNLIHYYWGAISSARPRQRTTIRGSTQARPAPHIHKVPVPRTRYHVRLVFSIMTVSCRFGLSSQYGLF